MEDSSEPKVKSLKEAMNDLQDYIDEKYPNVWNVIIYLEDEISGMTSHTFFGDDGYDGDDDDVEGLVNAIMHIVNDDLEIAEKLFVELGDLLISARKTQSKNLMDS